jgi:hypothetical protein
MEAVRAGGANVKTLAFVWRLAGLFAAAAITLASAAAWAHGGDEVDRGSSERSTGAMPEERGGQARGEGRVEAKGAEERFTLSLDMVLGWGNVPFAAQNLPTMQTQALTYTYRDATPSDVQSFVIAGSVEVAKHLALGARLPITFATFSPDGSAARSTTSLGNVELEAEYGGRVMSAGPSALSVVGSLGVALPTAQGDEIPPDLLGRDASSVDQNAYDRFSLNRAAALARGDEDSALFEPNRLGIVPKIALLYRGPLLSIEPSVKVENLVATSSSLEAPYIGEIVPAVRVGYRVRKVVELVLRSWATVRFAAASAERRASAAVEPSVALRFGAVLPYAGVILPLSGSPFDDSFFGIRLGVTGSF